MTLSFSNLADDYSPQIIMTVLSKETPTIYLLDDDASVLKATRRLLDSVGWNVEAFTDPIAFLGRAAVDSPSVAVIDIRMPDMNGLDVQKHLRRVAPSTRIIVLTSKDDPTVRITAMNAGASAFFIKGVENKEFLAGIKAAADSRN
jgi:FixJ family two-component response regulator